MNKPSFLLLQGPVGPFFRELARMLRQFGRVRRVAFNSGDALDARGDCEFFGLTLEHWPRRLANLLVEHAVTDVVLFGDCRPIHRETIAWLRERAPQVRVHVFEEGYLRPDWVTLERNGVNGFSPLNELVEAIHQVPEARRRPPVSLPVGTTALRLGAYAARHYALVGLGRGLLGHAITHRERCWHEGLRWTLRLASTPLRRHAASLLQRQLMARAGDMYLALLQIDSDAQVRMHSRFADTCAFIEEILPSFARHAPAGAFLVIKNHPLDASGNNYRQLINRLAHQHGVRDRVFFLNGGSLPLLLSRTRAAITINSTAGISALHRLVPLKALGQALYNAPGLASQQPLPEFWCAPQPPLLKTYRAFRHVVAQRSQINGSFYRAEGRAMIVDALRQRLRSGMPLSFAPDCWLTPAAPPAREPAVLPAEALPAPVKPAFVASQQLALHHTEVH
ncbi:capsule biosynthesis protein [Derxia lacustris]|uniref:capsule biosynthesis protein n=1 Tax=Derxia lacustris TaxID=764842 RepID=UPI0015936344|nr:capsular biosynthesis protein [Derxia lacustris]